MSGVSEQANGRASGPVPQSGFLVILALSEVEVKTNNEVGENEAGRRCEGQAFTRGT